MTNTILESLNENRFNPSQMCFLSYDHVSAMSGAFLGVCTLICRIFWGGKIHMCLVKHTEPTLQLSSDVKPSGGELFNKLEELYVFFRRSTRRYAVL